MNDIVNVVVDTELVNSLSNCCVVLGEAMDAKHVGAAENEQPAFGNVQLSVDGLVVGMVIGNEVWRQNTGTLTAPTAAFTDCTGANAAICAFDGAAAAIIACT